MPPDMDIKIIMICEKAFNGIKIRLVVNYNVLPFYYN